MNNNIICGLFTVLTIFVIALYTYYTINEDSIFIDSLNKTTKNGIIRGALMGYISGGIPEAISNAALWGIMNGTIIGINKYIPIS